MRNLKRALSLALASVMLVGLMVVGTGASYVDVSSKNNQEAIEVLQKVGIMTGDENGNFNPGQLVTRNEMAVVMCNLLDYRVSSYKGTSPFTDVPAWAEPYVAACYTNGIIAGYSATYFGGSDSVTTSQAALMLMKALGYFQYSSDFGDDWQLSTIYQGNKIDLFDDVESGVKDAMTRNDVAQLVLNTLASGMVEANKSGQDITVGDITITNGVTYSYVTSQKGYARAISELKAVSATGISTQGYIVELGEKLYDGDLKRSENVTDDFGRPATKWAYKTNEVGTYGDDPILTSNAKVTIGSLYSLIGSSNVNDLTMIDESLSTAAGKLTDATLENKLVVYQDGKIVSTKGGSVDEYFDRNSSNGAKSGKGVLTEVYQDDDNNVTIVYANTYVAQATSDYSKSKGSVNVTVLTNPAGYKSFKDLSDDDFDVAGIKEDDYILYTYAADEVQTIAKAELVSGEVTAYSVSTGRSFGDAGGSVTIDGTKHDYAKYAETNADNGCAVVYTVGINAVVVTDANGYVYYVDDFAASSGNYVYIDAAAKSSSLGSDVVADAYFADGTNTEIKIKKITTTKELDLSKANTVRDNKIDGEDIQGWYSYSKNSSDKYTLTLASTSSLLDNVTIKTDKVALGEKNGDSSVKYTVNKDTVFIVKDKDDDITVYTGIKNVPDINVGTTGTAGYVYAMKDKNNANKAASLVFVDAGSNGSVKNASKDSLIYLLKLDSTSVDNTNNEDVYTWKVVMDGEETSIKTKEDWKTDYTGNSIFLLEDYSINSDGYYEGGDAYDTSDDDKFADPLSGATISQSGDTMTINSRTVVVNDDTKIVLVMSPTAKSSVTSDVLRREIMTDWAADYELGLGMTAKGVANLLKGYDVDGTAYVTYDDASKSDVAVSIYVVVTAAAVHADP